MNTTPPWGMYQIKIRRDIGLQVKPEAEEMDGQRFRFVPYWPIDDDELYPGEWAMVPADGQGWMFDWPTWIASGDLVLIKAET